ncbi:Hypothetical protein HVR_LOCUS1036 [uncultured virus]|nr:Hypothetical protein HVR_LOCUS1036 [uncultured virus]
MQIYKQHNQIIQKKYNVLQIRAMNPFTKVWFWLLILSIIGFIISLVLYERYGQTNTGNSSTPGWIWVIFILSIIFWIVALVLYIVDVAAYHRRMEIAEACGELPPPKPKKKIECPKKECVEKKIIECVEKKPCDQRSRLESSSAGLHSYDNGRVVVVKGDELALPKVVAVNPAPEEAFSAAGLKPLNSLAPMSTTTATTTTATIPTGVNSTVTVSV